MTPHRSGRLPQFLVLLALVSPWHTARQGCGFGERVARIGFACAGPAQDPRIQPKEFPWDAALCTVPLRTVPIATDGYLGTTAAKVQSQQASALLLQCQKICDAEPGCTAVELAGVHGGSATAAGATGVTAECRLATSCTAGITSSAVWHAQQHEHTAVVDAARKRYGPVDPLVFAARVSARCAFLVNHTTRYAPECFQRPPTILRRLLITGSGGSGTHASVKSLNSGGVHVKHETIGSDGAVSWPYAVNDYQVWGWSQDPIVKMGNRHDGPQGKNGYVWGDLDAPLAPKGLPKRSDATMVLMEPRFEVVLHQTRCPLQNIAALLTHGPSSAAFIAYALPALRDRLPSVQCFSKVRMDGKNRQTGHVKPIVSATDAAALADREACLVEWAMLVYVHWNLLVEQAAQHRFRVETMDVAQLAAWANLTFHKPRVPLPPSRPKKRGHQRQTDDHGPERRLVIGDDEEAVCGVMRYNSGRAAGAHYSPLNLRCPSGAVFHRVEFADWGTPYDDGACLAAADAGAGAPLQWYSDDACSTAEAASAWAAATCEGRTQCTLDPAHGSVQLLDACPGQHKELAVVAVCRNSTGGGGGGGGGAAGSPGDAPLRNLQANHRQHTAVTPGFLRKVNASLMAQVEAMARRYGYAWDSDEAANCTLLS